jgi:hypothetical protein
MQLTPEKILFLKSLLVVSLNLKTSFIKEEINAEQDMSVKI